MKDYSEYTVHFRDYDFGLSNAETIELKRFLKCVVFSEFPKSDTHPDEAFETYVTGPDEKICEQMSRWIDDAVKAWMWLPMDKLQEFVRTRELWAVWFDGYDG